MAHPGKDSSLKTIPKPDEKCHCLLNTVHAIARVVSNSAERWAISLEYSILHSKAPLDLQYPMHTCPPVQQYHLPKQLSGKPCRAVSWKEVGDTGLAGKFLLQSCGFSFLKSTINTRLHRTDNYIFMNSSN
ncbi:hypothetical protein KIL84_022655 [Mauremys mutica]|uniref:Uncharacterized protein n=1 Tax=Mauremys mutica TaxID=74926 RepID=A0A9D3WNX0_9SAUR|nr:hypothetical protein KIL84_022655 [Mauremys mutica]